MVYLEKFIDPYHVWDKVPVPYGGENEESHGMKNRNSIFSSEV